MHSLIERYMRWFNARHRNLECTKGAVGKMLLARIQGLELEEQNLFAVGQHADVFRKIVMEFAEERQNLRWIQSLAREADTWSRTIRKEFAEGIDANTVGWALCNSDLDLDEAISMVV